MSVTNQYFRVGGHRSTEYPSNRIPARRLTDYDSKIEPDARLAFAHGTRRDARRRSSRTLQIGSVESRQKACSGMSAAAPVDGSMQMDSPLRRCRCAARCGQEDAPRSFRIVCPPLDLLRAAPRCTCSRGRRRRLGGCDIVWFAPVAGRSNVSLFVARPDNVWVGGIRIS